MTSQITAPGLGFSLARFDTASGVLAKSEFQVEAAAPACFVIHPDGRHLYASNSIKTFQGQPAGAVSAYAIDPPTGRLTLLNQQPSGGADANYVELDSTGRYLFVANYEGGNIAAFALRPDGSIGECTASFRHTGSSVNPQRQKHAYAHSIKIDPTNRFVLVGDLGLDKVSVYRFNARDGSMQPNEPPFVQVPPGSGPRHLTFHPNCAEIRMRPDGKFLYASNRGHDSLAVFAIDAKTGRLTVVERVPTQGKLPRKLRVRSNQPLAAGHHGSDNAVVFRIDENTGRLTQSGPPVPAPHLGDHVNEPAIG